MQTIDNASFKVRRRRKQGNWLSNETDLAQDWDATNRRSSSPLWLKGPRFLGKLLTYSLFAALLIHRALSWFMRHRSWIPAPITYLDRTCPAISYETMGPSHPPLQICITTLTDNPSTDSSIFQRILRWRNFDSILDLTWEHKAKYAARYGYRLIDGSYLLDKRRPPAWSKIKAVQDLLINQACDWVMWMDADTVIMNSSIQITDFLPPAHSPIDWLVASDKGGGYNSGVFVVRNTSWSKRLLQEWWDMKDFVRPLGLSLSGDNAALKALLALKLQDPSQSQHIGVPPRCTFNSFAKFLSLRESQTLVDDKESLKAKEWYMDNEHYHKGDFIAHTPGIDNKAECLKMLLREAD